MENMNLKQTLITFLISLMIIPVSINLESEGIKYGADADDRGELSNAASDDPIWCDSNSELENNPKVSNPTAWGTAYDPFIFENLNIDGTGNNHCIYIGNTTYHYIIRNCTFRNCGTEAVYFNNVDHGTIENCTLIGHGSNGFKLESSNYCRISNSTLVNNSGYGIFLIWESDHNILEYNYIENNSAGIAIRSSNYNVIKENICSSNDWDGIVFESINNRVLSNKCSDNRMSGISLSNGSFISSRENHIKDNLIMNNGINGISLGNSIADMDKTNLIEGNTIINNSHGIITHRTDEQIIRNNSISLCVHGIYLTDHSENNLIDGNLINRSDSGIRVSSRYNRLLENMISNCEHGIELQAHEIQVSCNKIWRNEVGIAIDYHHSTVCRNEIIENEVGIDLNSEEHFIVHNSIINNSEWGIDSMGEGCWIHYNRFIDNNVIGEQVREERYLSIWNDTKGIGNYWSDQQERYPDSKINGPIWDTPYLINGTLGSYDNGPLVSDDIIFSEILNLFEGPISTDDGFIFKMKYLGTEYLSGVNMETWTGDEISSMISTPMSIHDTYWSTLIDIPDSSETFNFRYDLTTSTGETILSEIYHMEIIDNDEPNAIIEGDEEWYKAGDLVSLSGRQSNDNVGIVNHTWSFTYQGSDMVIYGPEMNFIFEELGDYPVKLTVSDLGENTNSFEVMISIVESDSPVISDIVYDEEIPIYFADNAEIHFKVHDENPRRIKVIYVDPKNKMQNSSAEHLGGDDYCFKFSGIENTGRIRFHIWAEDEYLNSHETGEMTINIIDDPEPIVNISSPEEIFHDEEVQIFVNISSQIPISSGRCAYTGIDGKVVNGALVGDDRNWYFFIHSQDEEGEISFDVSIEFANGFIFESGAISIRVLLNNQGPEAILGNVNITIDQGDRLTFSANGSKDDEGIMNYTWIVRGEGSEISLYSKWAVHTFLDHGIFEVILIVKDRFGWQDEDSFHVTVLEAKNDVNTSVANITIRIGPLLDAGGKFMEGVEVNLMIDGDTLAGITGEYGMVELIITSLQLNRSVVVVINKEGYIPQEYETFITMDGALETRPGALIPLKDSDGNDGGVGFVALIAIIIIVLILLIAAGISFFLVYRRKNGMEDDGKEMEAGNLGDSRDVTEP